MGLLPEQTKSIEEEIIKNYFDVEKKLDSQVNRFQDYITRIIQDNSSMFDEKIKERQKAIEIDNKSAALAFLLAAKDFLEEGKLEKAFLCFNQSIEFNCEDPLAYYGLAVCVYKQGEGDVKEVLKYFKKAESLYQKSDPKLKEQSKKLRTMLNKHISERKQQNIFANFLEKLAETFLGWIRAMKER